MSSPSLLLFCLHLTRGQPFPSVLDFIATFAPPEISEFINSGGVTSNTTFSYDWRMNDYAMAGPPVSFW